jgi:hypothetical protein
MNLPCLVFPTKEKEGEGVSFKLVGIGPIAFGSADTVSAYTCHFGSIVAEAITSASLFSIGPKLNFHFTGSKIWACTVLAKVKRLNKAKKSALILIASS